MSPIPYDSFTIVMMGSGLLHLMFEFGLFLVLASNLRLSRWMIVATFGCFLMFGGAVAQFGVQTLIGGLGYEAIRQVFTVVSLVRLLAIGCFVLGISATLFDVRNQLRVAHAMLNKPPSANELR